MRNGPHTRILRYKKQTQALVFQYFKITYIVKESLKHSFQVPYIALVTKTKQYKIARRQ